MSDDIEENEGQALTQATVGFNVNIDAADIVTALGNNDESILAFITELLETADSVELRQRLKDRLNDWEQS